MADEQQPPQIRINAQYIKDLSFENPNSPAVLAEPPKDTGLNINVNVEAEQIDAATFEVVMKFDIAASSGETTIFIIDLSYAGVFTLVGIPQEQIEPACLVECPRLIFPFARRVIGDLTRDGGFMPLLLDPIDFLRLYHQNRSQQPEATA